MRTLIFLKPDGVRKCLMSELIRLNIRNSLRLVAYQLVQQPVEFWFEFYSVHANNPAFPDFRGFAGWLSSMPLPFQLTRTADNRTEQLLLILQVPVLLDSRTFGILLCSKHRKLLQIFLQAPILLLSAM